MKKIDLREAKVSVGFLTRGMIVEMLEAERILVCWKLNLVKNRQSRIILRKRKQEWIARPAVGKIKDCA